MFLEKSIFFAVLIILTSFSCNSKKKSNAPEDANMLCDKFFAKGQIQSDSHGFAQLYPSSLTIFIKKESGPIGI